MKLWNVYLQIDNASRFVCAVEARSKPERKLAALRRALFDQFPGEWELYCRLAAEDHWRPA